jgi:2-dehydropantoate 2-reductase
MKVLVYGAGVIGTLYAARLQGAGHEVTVLSRGSRLEDIQRHGLILEDVRTGTRSVTRVAVVGELLAKDSFDMALVAVRRDQLSGVMPALAANDNIPLFLFLLNNPSGSAAVVDVIGPDRVLLGFPGAGGAMEGHVVRYVMIAQQPTTIGEPSGMRTARLQTLLELLHACGFKVRIDDDMDAWLMAHAFFVTSVSGAIYLAGGHCRELSRSPALLKLMVDGTREGFSAVRVLGQPVHPFALKVLFTWMPRAFAVYYWRRFFSREIAEFIFARHACSSVAEMQALCADCRLRLAESGVSSLALERLYKAIDDYAIANGRGVLLNRVS